jgi:hypothetical protein
VISVTLKIRLTDRHTPRSILGCFYENTTQFVTEVSTLILFIQCNILHLFNEKATTYTYKTHTHTHMYVYTYICMYVCIYIYIYIHMSMIFHPTYLGGRPPIHIGRI